MRKITAIFSFLGLFVCFSTAFSQDLKTTINANRKVQDSLRKVVDGEKDSIVFNSKYIRYTTLKLTKDSIQTLPIDTSLVGVQNFSPLVQPRSPTVGTGNLGLAAKSLLFDPPKTIGFDAGFHSFDYYVLNHEDVRFYKARTQFTSVFYLSGGDKEQMLKLIHTQNIKKNWNAGANYNRIGANGVYNHQRGDHLNASFFTWYESPNNRYNLWVDGVFNTLKAQENGSIINQEIFSPGGNQLVDKLAESVRLYTAKQFWKKNSFLIKQSYFVGRIDSTGKNTAQNILPTNKISHTFIYDNSAYSFKKDETESDVVRVLPVATLYDPVFTNDSTSVKHIQNEFIYSFFLRAKGNSIIKNELKIDAGIKHDLYYYAQFGVKRDMTNFFDEYDTFQNVTLLGDLTYRFSNKVDLDLNVQQIFQGRNIGDFMYEAKSNLLLSKKAGRIVMGAYVQNKSPEEIFNEYKGNHYQWNERNNLDRTKIVNLSFAYVNDALKFDASAGYYLIDNYLYFGQGATDKSIIPMQESSPINLLKVSVGKRFTFRSYHLDGYVVYQKTDSENLLRTPEVYTFNSLYKDQTFFKVLKTQIGFDVRYNTMYTALSYSPAASQFYNGPSVRFSSKPVIDVWVKASLRRANLFIKYDYANQKLFSNGYYTVNDYPMQDKLFKFGLTWNFYD
ncbi:putative porin [Pedobacter sp. Du54]|uniref:putative porin n=1 Tax=Pedobacter anseongensis TaxID=3133439 RepID=UPI003098CED3